MEREWCSEDDALMSPCSSRAAHCLFAGFEPDARMGSPSEHERMQRRAMIKTASSLLSAALAKLEAAPGGYSGVREASTNPCSDHPSASHAPSDNEQEEGLSPGSKPIAIVRDR
jgi:hypothetical protein